MQKDKEINILPEIEVLRLISTGSFGVVYECINKKTGMKYAVKESRKANKYCSRERQILKALSGCPHIIQLVEHSYALNHEGKKTMMAVYEYCTSNLEDAI